MSELALEVTFVVLIVLVLFAVAAIMGTNIGKGIFDAISKYLPGSSGNTNNPDYKVASYSAGALSCAINSVVMGKDYNRCQSTFTQPSALGGAKVGGAIISDGMTWNGKTDESLYFADASTMPSLSGITGASGTTQYDQDITNYPDKSWVSCSNTNGKYVCTVNKFQLPQYVDNAEKYIMYYGDPQYLVYWNVFPISEDTWDLDGISWGMHLAMFTISIIPFGKVAGLGAKSVFYGAKATLAKTVTKEAADKIVAKEAEGMVAFGITETIGEATQILETQGMSASNLVYKVSAQTVLQAMKDSAKKSLTEIVKSRFTTRGASWMALKFGTLEGAAALAALIDSMSKKTEPVGNAIAFKESMWSGGGLTTFNMDDSWVGKPVILNSVPGTYYTQYKPFHLVSPCYLDHFTVEKEPVKCGTYTNRPEDKNSYCMDASAGTDSSFMTCGVWDNKVDSSIGLDGLYNRMQSWIGMQNKEIFGRDDKGGVTKVYLDVFGQNGYWLDIAHKHGPTASHDNDLATWNDYKLDLWSGSTKIKENAATIACPSEIKDDGFFNIFSSGDEVQSGFCQINIKYTDEQTNKDVSEIMILEGYTEDNGWYGVDTVTIPVSENSWFSDFISAKTVFKISDEQFVSFTDDNNDGKWETITAWNRYGRLYTLGLKTTPEKNSVSLSDFGADGKPKYIGMANCQTEGIVVDVSSFSSQSMKNKGTNYCFIKETTAQSALKIGKWSLLAAGAIGAALLGQFHVSGYIIFGTMVLSSASFEAADIIYEYTMKWP